MITKNNLKGVKKALVIGTGGGNDIVSAVWSSLYLHKFNIQTDIAGILSPVATHTFNGETEKEINLIHGEVRRIIQSKNDVEISFLDGLLPKYTKEQGIDIERFYDFSIRFGTEKLKNKLNELIKENNYDLVLAVDVGGDILTRGKQDPHILSPAMDLACLNVLKGLNINTLLLEFGLGTDGELRPEGMKQIINELKEKNLLLEENSLKIEDNETKQFQNIYREIQKTRHGNTGRMTLETLRNGGEKDIISNYFLGYRIGNLQIKQPLKIILPKEFQGKTYLINAKDFAKQREKTSFNFNNPLEQFIKLRNISRSWKNELDLFNIYSGDNYTTTEKKGLCINLLTFSNLLNDNYQKQIIEKGVELLKKGNSDLAIIDKKIYNKYNIKYENKILIGDYIIIHNSNIDKNELNKIQNDILSYQKTI